MGFFFEVGDRVLAIGKSGTITKLHYWSPDGEQVKLDYAITTDDGLDLVLPGAQLSPVANESFIVELTVTSEKAAEPDAVLAAVSEAAQKIPGKEQLHITGGAVRRIYDTDNAAQWGVQDLVENEPF